jgi:hypothetical protein
MGLAPNKYHAARRGGGKAVFYMAVFCALLILLSIVGVVVSVVRLIRKKPRAKTALIVCVAVFILAVVLMPAGESQSPGQEATASTATSEPAEPVQSASAEPTAEDSTAPVEDSAAPAEPSGPLLSAEVFTADVKNGTGTDVIGQRAYVVISKEKLQSVTTEEYVQFLNERVKDSGYNWYSIVCDDGTGICYVGSMEYIGEYGKIDSEGCISEGYGMITPDENGNYSYEEYES